jgi:tungstate transport system permease protein
VELLLDAIREGALVILRGSAYLWDVVRLSLVVSGTAVLLASAIGLPAGAAVGMSRFRGRGLVVATIYTGFALPPVVVGLFLYLLLSRDGLLGRLELLFTPTAMVIAQAALAAPYVAGITLAAVQAVPADVRQQARALGAGRTRAALAHLREAGPGLMAAVLAGFGAVISEVGAVMLVGGNIEGETRVMTTAIVLETRRGNFSMALALGLMLLVVVFAVNLLLSGSRVRSRGAAARPWA